MTSSSRGGDRPVNLNIASELFSAWPNLAVKAFRIDVLADSAVVAVKRTSTEEIRASVDRMGIDVQSVSSHPIIDGWRTAFGVMGLKPSTYKSSPEALARRFMKSGPIETPLHLVNCYCDISVANLAPLGAYDIGRFPTDDGAEVSVELRMVRSTDSFSPIGGRTQEFPLTSSVSCYAVADEIICWAFNCRDSISTCLVPTTRSALFVGEALNVTHHGALDAAIRTLHHDLDIPGILVGPIETLNSDHPTAEIMSLDLYST